MTVQHALFVHVFVSKLYSVTWMIFRCKIVHCYGLLLALLSVIDYVMQRDRKCAATIVQDFFSNKDD